MEAKTMENKKPKEKETGVCELKCKKCGSVRFEWKETDLFCEKCGEVLDL